MASPARWSLSVAIVAALFGSGGCVTTHHLSRPTTLEALQWAVETPSGPVAVLYRAPALPPSPQPARSGIFQNAPPASPSSGAQREVAANVLVFDAAGVWVAPPGGPLLLRLADVQGLEVKRRGLGALEGWGIGMLGGAALGALSGYSQGDDPPCMKTFPDCLFSIQATAGDKAVLGGVAGGVVGGLTGLLMGLAVGHTDRYLF